MRSIEDDDIEVDECGNESSLFVSYGSHCRVITTATSRLLPAVVPRKCIGEPKWVRVGAELGGGNESLCHIDRWAPPGHDDTQWWITPTDREFG